jgi:hypothetical protein
MTGYPDITYGRLNDEAALARSLTWLCCLDAAISKLHPYHVVQSAGRKATPSLRSQVFSAGFCILHGDNE